MQRSTGGPTLLAVGDDRLATVTSAPPAGVAGTAVRVTTVETALEELSPDVDCVVSAGNLPDGTGLELFEAVRARRRVPFVLAPADGDEAAASRALAAGVDAYVTPGTEGGESLPDAVERLTAADGGDAAPARRGPSGGVDDADEVGDALRAQLHRTSRRLEAVIEASPVGIVALNADGRVELWNEGAEVLFGYEAVEVIGERPPIVPEDRRAAFEERMAAVLAGETYQGLEVTREHRDGTELTVAVSTAPIRDPAGDVDGVVAVIEDRTERRERERRLDRYETVVETVEDVIYTVDGDGRFTWLNTDAEEVYGVPREEIVGRQVGAVIDGLAWSEPGTGERLAAAFEALLAGERDRIRRRVAFLADGEELALDLHVVPLEEDGAVVGAAGVNRDVTEQVRREERLADRKRELTALHDTARELLETETRHEIAEVVVAAAEEVLELSGVTLYLYDPSANELAPAAHSGDKDRLYGHLPTVDPGEGITGHVFLEGETTVHDDVHRSERMLNDAAAMRSGLFIPLGEHGILIAGDTAVGAFDEDTVERAELLAANAEAALDRAGREQALRAQGRTVKEQNRRLERLDEINRRIRRVDQALVHADTREEVERAVCEELVEGDEVAWVWIGAREGNAGGRRAGASDGGGRRAGTNDGGGRRAGSNDGSGRRAGANDGGRRAGTNDGGGRRAGSNDGGGRRTGAADAVARRAVAGDDEGYLDRVELPAADVDADAEPVARALDAGEPVAVPAVAEDPRGRPWRREALRRDVRSVAAFPLVHDGVDYGALGIYATGPDAFDELSSAVLGELADTVADAVHAAEQHAALTSDHRVECEFALAGATGGLADLAAALGEPVTVTSVSPRPDGDRLVTATVPEAAAASITDADAELPAVREASVVAAGSPSRVRFVVEALPAWERLSTTAGRPRELSVDGDGGARATVTLPGGTAVTAYADRLADQFDDVELLARRQHPVPPEGRLGADVGLTERQREVLSAAYHAGFFEWPRDSTGEEVAAGLDISQPAFLRHVRTGERKLVAALLGAED